jgi:hypothetical protein
VARAGLACLNKAAAKLSTMEVQSPCLPKIA